MYARIREDKGRLTTFQPYAGPYKVVSRSESGKNYIIDKNGIKITANIERLKPAYFFAQEMQQDTTTRVYENAMPTQAENESHACEEMHAEEEKTQGATFEDANRYENRITTEAVIHKSPKLPNDRRETDDTKDKRCNSEENGMYNHNHDTTYEEILMYDDNAENAYDTVCNEASEKNIADNYVTEDASKVMSGNDKRNSLKDKVERREKKRFMPNILRRNRKIDCMRMHNKKNMYNSKVKKQKGLDLVI